MRRRGFWALSMCDMLINPDLEATPSRSTFTVDLHGLVARGLVPWRRLPLAGDAPTLPSGSGLREKVRGRRGPWT